VLGTGENSRHFRGTGPGTLKSSSSRAVSGLFPRVDQSGLVRVVGIATEMASTENQVSKKTFLILWEEAKGLGDP